MEVNIQSYFKEHCRIIENIDNKKIMNISTEIIKAYKNNKKVIIFGNGGSAADAQHFAAEFIGRFEKERRALPALVLHCNTSSLTAIANDYGYVHVFERQIEAFAESGDIAIALSTSGNSENVIYGIIKAKEKGCLVIGITGKNGGKLKSLIEDDYLIKIDSEVTSHIQEATITILHLIAKIVENELFK